MKEEIKELLDKTRPADEILAEMRREKIDFDKDPEFMASYCKAAFVSGMVGAMEEQGLDIEALAKKLKYPRWVIRDMLKEDGRFSICRMAKIACALGMKLEVRMIKLEESNNDTTRDS